MELMKERSGYLYAIEGVLASMLVVFYLSTLIASPVAEDWTRTAISKQSGDLITAFSRSGVLDRAVRENEQRILDGLLVAMDARLDYSMHVRGLPKRTVDMLVVMTGDDIIRRSNRRNITELGGELPESESGYRNGTFQGVPFAVADTNENGITRYTTVSFDFDSDGEWGETAGTVDEGPYAFGDLVHWCPGGTCTQQWFRVGYINETVTLYNVSSYPRFLDGQSFEANGFHLTVTMSASQLFPPIRLDGDDVTLQGNYWTADIPLNGVTLDVNISAADNRTVYLNETTGFEGPYTTGDTVQVLGEEYTIKRVDPSSRSFYASPRNALSADIMFLDGVDLDYLDTHNETIREFLLAGNTVFERMDLSTVERDRFRSSFQSELGFRLVNLSLVREGADTNVFTTQGSPSTAAGFVSSYFYATDLSVPQARFDDGPYHATTILVRGERYRVNTSGGDWAEIGQSLTGAPNYSVGDRVQAAGNLFTLESTYPLNMTPEQPYRFRNYMNATMIGGQPVLTVRDWEWNTSVAAGESVNVSTSPGGGEYEGLPTTECSDTPYRNASFSFDEVSYDLKVVLTNFDQDTDCDDAYEYVNFDLTDNGTFNEQREETGPGYGKEGIYRNRQTVTMANKTFQILLAPDGEWIYLRRQPPDTVPTMLWRSRAYRGNGNVFYMGGRRFGDDGMVLFRAALARAAVERYRLGEEEIIGSPSVGLSVSDSLDTRVFSPYTVDSVWWFQ